MDKTEKENYYNFYKGVVKKQSINRLFELIENKKLEITIIEEELKSRGVDLKVLPVGVAQ